MACGATEEGLQRTYEDIVGLAEQCHFRDCQHRTEPNCAVTAAIESDRLDPQRLAAWRKLQREVARVQDRREGWERARHAAKLKSQVKSYRSSVRNNPTR